jgi:GT2 family glycosyltransferase
MRLGERDGNGKHESAGVKTAAVILNWNQAPMTEKAAMSVLDDVESVYLVDNGSRASDRDRLEKFSRMAGMNFIGNDTNLGYAAGNNVGIRRALLDGWDAVLVMNNDATAHTGAVRALAARLLAAPHVGVVAPTVVDIPSGRVLHTSCRLDLNSGRAEWEDSGIALKDVHLSPRPTGYVSGEAFLARTGVFREIGAFDERFFCYYEDVEWSVRVRRSGWKLEVVPSAVFDHIGGGSGAGLDGAFYRARNSPLFLRWGLGKSRWEAIGLSAGQQLMRTARQLRHGHIRAAFAGTVAGWASGIAGVLGDE